jgi:Tfp pilus assembly protein PilO
VTRNYRIVLAAVLLAATVGAYWMFLLAPKRKEAADLGLKVGVAQAQVAQERATLAEYQKAQKNYKRNYETVVRLGKAVPADDDTRSLLVQLDTTAKRSGVDFANIDLQQTSGASTATATATTGQAVIPGAVTAGAFSTMPFTFGFSGNYRTLSSFFSRVDRFVTVNGDSIHVHGRLLRIDSISLTPGEGGWPAIRAQIGASTYVVPETSATAQGPAGTTPAGTATSTTTTTSSPSTSTGTSTSTASDIR